MALYPRMTRPGLRIAIEALEAYLSRLDEDGQQVATDVIRELRNRLDSANKDNRRRNDFKKTE